MFRGHVYLLFGVTALWPILSIFYYFAVDVTDDFMNCTLVVGLFDEATGDGPSCSHYSILLKLRHHL
jgi:hypothetical protein